MLARLETMKVRRCTPGLLPRAPTWFGNDVHSLRQEDCLQPTYSNIHAGECASASLLPRQPQRWLYLRTVFATSPRIFVCSTLSLLFGEKSYQCLTFCDSSSRSRDSAWELRVGKRAASWIQVVMETIPGNNFLFRVDRQGE